MIPNIFIDALKESGRYNQVIKILDKIISDTKLEGETPVSAYVDENNNTQWRVDAISVKMEASLLKGALLYDNTDIFVSDYDSLRQYVSSKTDIMLHNYAIEISYRKDKHQIKMGTIRGWLCLDNIIYNIPITREEAQNKTSPLYYEIPKAWRKKKKEDMHYEY